MILDYDCTTIVIWRGTERYEDMCPYFLHYSDHSSVLEICSANVTLPATFPINAAFILDNRSLYIYDYDRTAYLTMGLSIYDIHPLREQPIHPVIIPSWHQNVDAAIMTDDRTIYFILGGAVYRHDQDITHNTGGLITRIITRDDRVP
jgi:hypothetical protein